MTRDDIIRMARNCDLGRVFGPLGTMQNFEWEILHRFAHAAYEAGAAAERERIIAANAPEIERINAYIKANGDNT